MKLSNLLLSATDLRLALAAPAHADDWFVRAGLSQVAPASNNGTLADGALRTDVGDQTGLGLVFGRR